MAVWSYFKAALTHGGKPPLSRMIDIDEENQKILEIFNNYKRTYRASNTDKYQHIDN